MQDVTRARELARRYFDGLLSPAESDELQRLLQRSPDAADAFAGIARLEAALTETFAQGRADRRDEEFVETIGRQQRRRTWLRRALTFSAAACVLLAVWAAWLMWPIDVPARRGVEVVGTLEQRDGVARVTSGEAVVSLPDGSRVRLDRGSEFVVPTPDAGRVVEMRSGKGDFAVSEADVEFRVETPVGRVSALGTEFSITLTDERKDDSMKLTHWVMAVVVASGTVLVDAGGEPSLLTRGQSGVFGQERKREDNKDERKREERKPAAQRGLVLEVGDKSLTLASRENREGTAIDVPETAKVFVDGKPAKLADLSKGMMVVIEKGDKDAIVAIRAEGPTLNAVVKSAAKDKVTVKARGRERGEETQEFAMAKDAKVTIDGKAGAATDLKEGDTVGLTLSADRKSVVALVKGQREERGRANRSGGIIASVSAKDNTLALKTEGDDRDVPLAKDVKVTIDGKPGKLADLKAGDRITMTIDRENRVVTEVTKVAARDGGERPRGRPVVGKVKGTEKSDSTITLLVGDNDEEKVYGVAKDAKISIDGKATKLEDVKADVTVRLTLGRDGKTVVEIADARARGEREKPRAAPVAGKVTKPAKDGVLTVVVARGEEGKEFKVAKDVKVSIDGKESKIEDVKEGMVVSMVLDDEKVVKQIAVGAAKRREK